MRRVGLFFASGFGIGYIPWASGTFGTLWGVLAYYLLRQWSLPAIAIFDVVIFIIAIVSSHWAEKALSDHDSSIIVIDEVIGYLFAVLWIPFSFWNMALAFALFRIFDILKPPPIRSIDRQLPGAWGVVLDDVLAGIFSNILLRLLLLIWR